MPIEIGELGSISKGLFINIEGLRSRKRKDKLWQHSELAVFENIILMAVAESHLQEHILSGEDHIEEFYLQRVERGGGVKKGGVALFLRQDIAHLFGDLWGGSLTNTEYLSVYSQKLNLVVAVIYRPEGSSGFVSVLSEVQRYAAKWAPPLPNVLVVGDFNFPHVNWTTGEISGGEKSRLERCSAQQLFSFNEQLCLTQLVDLPTRGPNILDLVLTNNCDMVHSCTVLDTDMSDHRLILISLSLEQVTHDADFRTKLVLGVRLSLFGS